MRLAAVRMLIGVCVAAGVVGVVGGMAADALPSSPSVRGPLENTTPPLSPTESPAAKAERVFFEALNRRPERRPEAMDALWAAVNAEPRNGRLNLLLGLGHLWITAESPEGSRESVEHAILAEHHLAAARRLMPEDDRVVSWLSAVRIRLGERAGDAAAVENAWAELRAAVKADPCFHAVAMGILRFAEPRGSAEFTEGLEAMRAAASCGAEDASVQNRERWPHNLEGFALALAQFELKAGNRQRAETMLMFAQERPTYGAWPHREVLEKVFDGLNDAGARYANEDLNDDPPLVVGRGSGVSCRVCHQGP